MPQPSPSPCPALALTPAPTLPQVKRGGYVHNMFGCIGGLPVTVETPDFPHTIVADMDLADSKVLTLTLTRTLTPTPTLTLTRATSAGSTSSSSSRRA